MARMATRVISTPLNFSIVIAARRNKGMQNWGDFAFAQSLGKALEKRGHKVRIDSMKSHQDEKAETDVDLFIRGMAEIPRHPSRLTMMLMISHPYSVGETELRAMDHVFVASQPWTEKLRAIHGAKISPLL